MNREPNAKPEVETVLSVKDLNISFGNNHVLRNFDLELKKGENLVVLGKSGRSEEHT